MKKFSRVIWILSLVSLFNDCASEMLIPVMPFYLKSIGFTVLFIGILEGFAGLTASFSTGYFGKLSDISGKRTVFVKSGYTLSALSKPLILLFINPLWVFFIRTLDRLGKGLRTGARDAILSEESETKDRAKVFGFNRSMDTLGAAIGPSFALLFLYFNPGRYTTLFIFSFFPGIIAVILTLFLKDKKYNNPVDIRIKPTRVSFFSQLSFINESNPEYKRLLTGLLLFALFNSSDVFLILKLKESKIGDTIIIGIYIFYNLVYAFTSYPAGIIADKIGIKNIFLLGIFLFSLVYLGMAMHFPVYVYLLLFLIYGLYYSCTEGIAKAWLSLVCKKKDIATAIGVYSGFQGICAFIASTLTGFVWADLGSTFAFIITSCVALVSGVYLLLMTKRTMSEEL